MTDTKNTPTKDKPVERTSNFPHSEFEWIADLMATFERGIDTDDSIVQSMVDDMVDDMMVEFKHDEE